MIKVSKMFCFPELTNINQNLWRAKVKDNAFKVIKDSLYPLRNQTDTEEKQLYNLKMTLY